jgi:predicted metal-dependent peptidase
VLLAEVTMTPKEKLQYARTILSVSSPFFATLALQTDVHFKKPEEAIGPTAWTDGLRVYFNENFASSLSREEFTAVLMHELLHIAFLHVPRRQGRRPRRWNKAADYATNWLIAQEAERVTRTFGKPKFVLPDDALLDKKFADMSAEQVYAKLEEEEQEDDGDGDFGLFGDILQGDASIGNDSVIAEVKQRLAQAVQAAKLRGTLPAGVERMVYDILNPPRDWRRELADLIETFPADFTFAPPDRRFHDADFVLPSLGGEQVELAVAFDTSGSISPEELKLYLSEVVGMMQQFDHIKLRVLTCDAAVHEDVELEEHDIDSFAQRVRFKGGGGTDFRPVFERLKDDRPRMLVFFTDGYGAFPSQEPDYPVLWVLTPNSIDMDKVPFGRVTKLQ